MSCYIDRSLYQIIGSYESFENVVNVGTKYYGKHENSMLQDISGVEKTYIVFIDNPVKAPKDCVYYIKIF